MGAAGEGATFEEQMMFDDLGSFQEYLNKSQDAVNDDREQIQEQITQEEDALKASMMHEEMQETAFIEDSLEDADLEEEEQMSEREADQNEKLGQNGQERRQNILRSKIGKDAEKLHDKNEDEQEHKVGDNEKTKLIQDNKKINENGDEALGEDESTIDDAKKEIKEEKDLATDHIKERDEDLGSEKHDKKVDPQKKDQHEFREKAEAKGASTEKHEPHEKSSQQSQSIAANVDNSLKAEPSIAASKGQKSKKSIQKSEMQKDFETLAQQIISEAHVLEKGDVLETTISLNMQGSLFDGGEVTVKTYRFSPFEVNLDFKKFGHTATGMMKKNSASLKKVLKENDLTVHQLHIIE